MTAELIKTDRNGTRYYEDHTCPKCGGKGYIEYFAYVDGGVCCQCGGSGRYTQRWKEYTPEYAEKLEQRRIASLVAKAPEKNAKLYKKLGMNADGKCWLVLGNSYERKEVLKANGAKFLNRIGWVFDHEPTNAECAGLPFVVVGIADIAWKSDTCEWRYSDDMAMDFIKNAKEQIIRENDTTEYLGEVGEKLEVVVTLVRTASYDNGFGTIRVYTFNDANGNVLVWKTHKYLECVGDDGIVHGCKEGCKLRLVGKIKDLSEYRGKKQTVLTRCKYQAA